MQKANRRESVLKCATTAVGTEVVICFGPISPEMLTVENLITLRIDYHTQRYGYLMQDKLSCKSFSSEWLAL